MTSLVTLPQNKRSYFKELYLYYEIKRRLLNLQLQQDELIDRFHFGLVLVLYYRRSDKLIRTFVYLSDLMATDLLDDFRLQPA